NTLIELVAEIAGAFTLVPVDVTKKAIEDSPRVDLFRIRRGFRAPGEVVGVSAAIAGIAVARLPAAFAADLEGGKARSIADRLGHVLIGGDAGADVGPIG